MHRDFETGRYPVTLYLRTVARGASPLRTQFVPLTAPKNHNSSVPDRTFVFSASTELPPNNATQGQQNNVECNRKNFITASSDRP